jgi:hypothetical protein
MNVDATIPRRGRGLPASIMRHERRTRDNNECITGYHVQWMYRLQSCEPPHGSSDRMEIPGLPIGEERDLLGPLLGITRSGENRNPPFHLLWAWSAPIEVAKWTSMMNQHRPDRSLDGCEPRRSMEIPGPARFDSGFSLSSSIRRGEVNQRFVGYQRMDC